MVIFSVGRANIGILVIKQINIIIYDNFDLELENMIKTVEEKKIEYFSKKLSVID